MENKTFNELNLIAPIMRAIETKNYKRPTAIQFDAIPHLLAGRDMIGCAQTGTGKTAAFALPILQNIAAKQKSAVPKHPRVVVLSPTRELALQLDESFRVYGKNLNLKQIAVFGGVKQKAQVQALSRGVDILIATPGRFLDLMNQGHIKLSDVEIFVLDEADRMLDMGFLPDVKRVIAKLPKNRQSMLFSATMLPQIRDLANGILINPVNVTSTPPTSTAELIDDRVLFVENNNKYSLLSELLARPETGKTLVFTKTKAGANKLLSKLMKSNIRAEAIHGNKSQSARIEALNHFRDGRCKVLIATDIVARGIDVKDITHVINYDLPSEPESYIHRIGRTARAGTKGIALSFCGTNDRLTFQGIERLLKRSVPLDKDHAYHSECVAKICLSLNVNFTKQSFRSFRPRRAFKKSRR